MKLNKGVIFLVINVSKKSHVKWNDEMFNEALSLGGDKICDIFPPNVASNVNSARIDCYANILMGEIEDVLTPNQDVILVDIHDNGFNYKLVNLLKNRYPKLAIVYPCYRYTVAGPIFEKFRFY